MSCTLSKGRNRRKAQERASLRPRSPRRADPCYALIEMGLYARHIFPRLMDLTLRHMGDQRAAALSRARGDVLEIGFGTGLNLPYYPRAVRRLTALDPLDALERRVAARVAAAPFPVERVHRPAGDRLPFPDGSFDGVVTTWTLCSIPEPVPALREMRRVLRPDGLYLFLEHGRSADDRVARWQRRLNPIQRRVGCGCRLDLPIDALVREAGFELAELQRFVTPGEPRLLAEMYQGVAAKAPFAIA